MQVTYTQCCAWTHPAWTVGWSCCWYSVFTVDSRPLADTFIWLTRSGGELCLSEETLWSLASRGRPLLLLQVYDGVCETSLSNNCPLTCSRQINWFLCSLTESQCVRGFTEMIFISVSRRRADCWRGEEAAMCSSMRADNQRHTGNTEITVY